MTLKVPDEAFFVFFSQLTVDDEARGIHAILVRIRDEDMNIMPGVRVEDMGHKIGLNGVDNAKLFFDNVRVPRENLLNRLGFDWLRRRFYCRFRRSYEKIRCKMARA